MRPVRRRAAPQASDFDNYRDAYKELVARLGLYCSYCERKIVTVLHVEHIQPKGLPQYAHIIGRWDNFLLACVNCNATKQDKDVNIADVLLPDRDNTAIAFEYRRDGTLRASASNDATIQRMGKATLALTGLDKPISQVLDENGKLVAIDRVAQRMEAWLLALDARSDIDAHPGNLAVLRGAARTAKENGFFSVWMEVFAQHPAMRKALIDPFPGTAESECFDPQTTQPISPAPNPDQLAHGGKL